MLRIAPTFQAARTLTALARRSGRLIIGNTAVNAALDG